MAAPMPLTGHRAKLPPSTSKSYTFWPSTEAKRCGQAERSGEGGFGGVSQLRHSNSHARRRSPNLAQGRSGSPQLRHNTARPRAEESQAQRPGRAQRRRGARRPPSIATTQLARTPKNAKPSAAAKPSASEKGGSGASPNYDNPIRTHAGEAQA
jgi:hypothetical protein